MNNEKKSNERVARKRNSKRTVDPAIIEELLTVENNAGRVSRKKETTYNCLECLQAFTKKSLLQKHIIRRHAPGKVFTCEDCQKVFYNSVPYKRHCFSSHGRTHPYKCEECQRRFTLEASLNEHMKLHRGEKNCLCKLCGKCFLHDILQRLPKHF